MSDYPICDERQTVLLPKYFPHSVLRPTLKYTPYIFFCLTLPPKPSPPQQKAHVPKIRLKIQFQKYHIRDVCQIYCRFYKNYSGFLLKKNLCLTNTHTKQEPHGLYLK